MNNMDIGALEEDIQRNERMIKMAIAVEYLSDLLEPEHREIFVKAEKAAQSPDDMLYLIKVAKKHIGQRAARELMGI